MRQLGYRLLLVRDDNFLVFVAQGYAPIVIDASYGEVRCGDLRAQVVDWGGVSQAPFDAALEQL